MMDLQRNGQTLTVVLVIQNLSNGSVDYPTVLGGSTEYVS